MSVIANDSKYLPLHLAISQDGCCLMECLCCWLGLFCAWDKINAVTTKQKHDQTDVTEMIVCWRLHVLVNNIVIPITIPNCSWLLCAHSPLGCRSNSILPFLKLSALSHNSLNTPWQRVTFACYRAWLIAPFIVFASILNKISHEFLSHNCTQYCLCNFFSYSQIAFKFM